MVYLRYTPVKLFEVGLQWDRSYSYITSTSRISLLLHETEGYPTSACDITSLYPTAFDYKQQ